MLFLGHAKSNFEMMSRVFVHLKVSSSFGRQANKYLRDVQALRCTRFFDAHPLSTSNWGTGVWVSENYVFLVRALNFLSILPAITDCKQKEVVMMLLRFASAYLSATSRIMSEKKTVSDMEDVVKIYMNTMVEMDHYISTVEQQSHNMNSTAAQGSSTSMLIEAHGGSSTAAQSSTSTNVDGNESAQNAGGSNTAVLLQAALRHPPAAKKKQKKLKDPNYCKSNSLGILSAADSHSWFGPATLHWEGGWAGERKIQQAKALLGIKRSTADWQGIVLTTLMRHDTLKSLLDGINENKNGGSSKNNTTRTREMEGHMRVYKNSASLQEEIQNCKPLSAMLHKDGSIWMAYRPSTQEFNLDDNKATKMTWSRSSLQLLQLQFHDESGSCLSHLCWFAPIFLDSNQAAPLTLNSTQDLKAHADQFLLLLPMLGADENYQNMYYAIGSKWTQRIQNGSFGSPQLQLQPLFNAWLHDTTSVAITGGATI
jgi:hypothetical protein